MSLQAVNGSRRLRKDEMRCNQCQSGEKFEDALLLAFKFEERLWAKDWNLTCNWNLTWKLTTSKGNTLFEIKISKEILSKENNKGTTTIVDHGFKKS